VNIKGGRKETIKIIICITKNRTVSVLPLTMHAPSAARQRPHSRSEGLSTSRNHLSSLFNNYC